MGSNGNSAVAADALLKESEAIHYSRRALAGKRRALAEKLLEEGRALAGPLIEQVKDPERKTRTRTYF